jgi:hypothetical protein
MPSFTTASSTRSSPVPQDYSLKQTESPANSEEIAAYRRFVSSHDSRLYKVLSLIPCIGSIASFASYVNENLGRVEDNAERACRTYQWARTQNDQKSITQEILRSKIEISNMRVRNFTRATGSSILGLIGTQILIWHPATGPALITTKVGLSLLMAVIMSPAIWAPCSEALTRRKRAATAQLELGAQNGVIEV